jgi:hypothetical protein
MTSSQPPEDELVPDPDYDWDSEGKRDRGPERPAHGQPLPDPESGPKADPGDTAIDPDEDTGRNPTE